jgi:hypothetical protein
MEPRAATFSGIQQIDDCFDPILLRALESETPS